MPKENKIESGRIVELSLEDFQEMVQRIKNYKNYIDELETINNYLTGQIDDYNKKFADKNK